MPELPEVQTVIDTLRPRLLGARILSIPHLRRDIVIPESCDLPPHLIGRSIANLSRRGKRIIFTLDDGNRFYIHLGMTGRLTLEGADGPVQKHTHAIIAIECGMQNDECRTKAHKSAAPRASHSSFLIHPSSFPLSLRFRDPRRFGGIWWLGKDSPAGDMGPEPLLMRPAQLLRGLSHTTRAIKNVLLDQTVVAGIGNIYADESLFLARIHPLTPANTLSAEEAGRLNRAIKLTLRRALRHRGSTLRDYVDGDGVKGAYQKQHRVYDRAEEPCRVCKSPIERLVLGGRSAHFCPNCQPPR
jgi:formamidopyrimidine-DNA glycosylase